MDSGWETDLKSLTGGPRDTSKLGKRKSKLKALKALQSREADLLKKIEEKKEQYLEFDADALNEIAQTIERIEREKNRAQLYQVLKGELQKLTERNQELQQQIRRHADCLDYLKRAAEMSVFQTAERLADHLENILHIRSKVFQKDSEEWVEVEQLQKTCAALKKKQRFQQLQRNTKLLQLQTELQRACSEVQVWEKWWDHFQKTATEQQIEVAQIKMAVLNVFEMTGDKEHVAIDDTDTELDKIKLFFLDHVDILKKFLAKHFDKRHQRKQTKPKQVTSKKKT
ncbi:uncharacterized protein V6R79_014390 [Siganus canaliculatus]